MTYIVFIISAKCDIRSWRWKQTKSHEKVESTSIRRKSM